MSELDSQQGEESFDPFAERKKEKSGGGVAWLALLVAAVVAAWSGWQWWQARSGVDFATEQAGTLAEIRTAQQDIGRQLAELQGRQQALEQTGLEAEIEALGAGLERIRARLARESAEDTVKWQQAEGLQDTLAQMQQRLAASEAALAALAVRGESAGKRIELAEVDFLLRMANERLRLFGDARGARQALALADSLLAVLDDPLYLPVRQAIATAELEIDEMPRVDTVTLTQRLAHLQSRIPTWPFPGEDAPVKSPEAGVAGEEAPGIWARFKATMAGLVTVRRRVAEEELLSLADKDYLRQGCWLQIESARLALMRADQAAYLAALERADQTLRQYFDGDARSVQNALSVLEELAAARIESTAPDISQPWAMLNGLRSDPELAAPVTGEGDASETNIGETDTGETDASETESE